MNNKTVKCPYNFVPLNVSVIEAPIKLSKMKDGHNTFAHYNGRYSGHISGKIETLGPVFIGGKIEEYENDPDIISPYRVNDQVRIPASSIRGLLRTMAEVIGYGKLTMFNDNDHFYRNSKVSPSNRYFGDIKAGFLIKIGNNYEIIPTSYKKKRFNNLNRNVKSQLRNSNGIMIWCNPNSHYLISGNIMGKRHIFEIDNPPNRSGISLSTSDINTYKTDKLRGTGDPNVNFNLLKVLNNFNHDNNCQFYNQNQKMIPCFYVEDGDHIYFGHAKYFRIPYKNRVSDFIPDVHKKGKLDLVESIFGKVDRNNSIRGRLQFFDATPDDKSDDILLQSAAAKKLLEPKSQSYHFYLDQSETNNRKIVSYNDNEGIIAGRKFYWHHPDSNWKEKKSNIDRFNKKIRPIKKDKNFTYEIRFRNLSLIELGFLLSLQNLPEGCAHKIGMGKPLGLGSIRFKDVKLKVFNPKVRYGQLFNKEVTDFVSGFEPINVNSPINEFINFLLSELSETNDIKNPNSIWELPELSELRIMLTVENGNKLANKGALDYVDYSQPQFKYKKQFYLPIPSEFLKHWQVR